MYIFLFKEDYPHVLSNHRDSQYYVLVKVYYQTGSDKS